MIFQSVKLLGYVDGIADSLDTLMRFTASLASYMLPILFSVGLLGLSVFTLIFETSPFTNGLNSPEQRFTYLEQETIVLSSSILGQRIVLNDCLEAIAGPVGKAQPTSRRTAVLQNCNTLATNIVISNPSFALSWYIAAFSSAELGQFIDFNSQITTSQKTAPNEQWLAELRVDLVEDNLPHLSVEAKTSHEADLRLLVQSRLGVASIASRYVSQSDFRERITRVVETLSNEEQRRFVGYVRSAARAGALQRGSSQ